MSTSSAPDVDRVLDRMGRAAFSYRSFPNPADETVEAAPEPEIAADPLADQVAEAPGAPAGSLFGLVSEALGGMPLTVPASVPGFRATPAPEDPPPAAVSEPSAVAASGLVEASPSVSVHVPVPAPAAVHSAVFPTPVPASNPFGPSPSGLPLAASRPAQSAGTTPLADMFRKLSGGAVALDDKGGPELAFPFRRR
jgi:hypothetical protein